MCSLSYGLAKRGGEFKPFYFHLWNHRFTGPKGPPDPAKRAKWAPSCPGKPFFGPFPRFSGNCPKIPRGGYDLAIFWRILAGPGGGLWGAPAPRAGPILTVKNRGFRPLGPWRAPRCEKLFLAILTFFWPFSGWKTKKRQKLMKKGDWAKGPRGTKSSRIYSRISAPAPNFRAPQPPPSVPKLAVLGQKKKENSGKAKN